jgi:ribose 5-phosphate isomerase B
MLGPELQDKMLRTWLETPFEGGRHARRVAKIAALEPHCE